MTAGGGGLPGEGEQLCEGLLQSGAAEELGMEEVHEGPLQLGAVEELCGETEVPVPGQPA